MVKEKIVHLRMPAHEAKKLVQAAEKVGMPLATFIRVVLMQYNRTPLNLKLGA